MSLLFDFELGGRVKNKLVMSLVLGMAIAAGCTDRKDMNKNPPGLAPASNAFLPAKGGSPVPTEETSGPSSDSTSGTSSGTSSGTTTKFGSTKEQTLRDTGSVPGSGGAGTSNDLKPVGTGDDKSK
jgi:hypothetical protein